MIEHPPYTWMTGFLRGKLNPRKRRAYVAHLFSGCESCRQEIAPIARVMFRPGCATELKKGGAEYDGPVDRAVLSAIERSHELKREREEAEAHLAGLGHEGWKSISKEPEFWTRGLCEILLERSWALRHDNAQEMCRLASFAREAADRLDPKVYGGEETYDMRARAWGEYANACRVTDDIVQADWAFNRALELRKQGSGAPLLRARLAELIAGLLSHQRHFGGALRALDLAYTLYMRHGHMHEVLRVLISRGIYTGRSGDPELALVILSRALDFAKDNAIKDPKLSFIALHNILLFRVECGDFAEARRQLFGMRALYAKYAGAADSLKLRGIESRIAAGLGDYERAERGFRELREEFEKCGQVYLAAVAGLDLAAVWLQKGRLSEVKRMVSDILDVFRSLHVARESIAALLMLRAALDRDRASQELIRGVASLIELHQDDVAQAHP